MSTIETDRFRRLLLEERKRVSDALDYLHAENPGTMEDETGEEITVDNHPADAATITFDREMDYTLEDNSENVLIAIDAALGRLDEGTYGVCQRCGRQIAPERLEARPWASLCIDCQREVER
jgi:RNA polymerase-binding protein DksA